MPKTQTNTLTNAAAAAALVKSTAEATATALNIQYIQRDITEIKQGLKDIAGAFVSQTEFKSHLEVNADQENRLREIEKNMWKWLGIASAIGVILGFVIPLIYKMV